MRTRDTHLGDDQVIEVYLDHDARRPESGAAAHLHDCLECTARYQELVGALGRVRQAVVAETDGLFTQARLTRQREELLRRLEQADRAARVLHFPAPQRPAHVSRDMFRRWIAGAAAAGLLIGLGAGRLINFRPDTTWLSLRQVPAVTQPPEPASSLSAAMNVPLSDEVLLEEIETAVVGPSIAELRAIDALTPRIVEVMGSGR